MCHDNEEQCKRWIGIDLSVQNWHEEFDKFWPKHLKISNICTLMGWFWPKYIMFEPKKVQRIYVWWYWIVMQNLNESWLVLSKMTWHDIFQQINKAPHFSFFLFFFFFFFLLRIFLKIISKFCISQWSVRRKIFDKLQWLFQLGVFVIFAMYLASICILLAPLFTDLLVRNSF